MILISNKIYFKTKTITKDKEMIYIMIKGSFQEENITFVNICVLNIGVPKYILGETEKLTVIRY